MDNESRSEIATISREEMERRAVEIFGTTENPPSGGVIISDGRMIPMADEHEDIAKKIFPGEADPKELMLDLGVVRYRIEGPYGYVDFRVLPTPNQIRRINKICVGLQQLVIECTGSGEKPRVGLDGEILKTKLHFPLVRDLMEFINKASLALETANTQSTVHV